MAWWKHLFFIFWENLRKKWPRKIVFKGLLGSSLTFYTCKKSLKNKKYKKLKFLSLSLLSFISFNIFTLSQKLNLCLLQSRFIPLLPLLYTPFATFIYPFCHFYIPWFYYRVYFNEIYTPFATFIYLIYIPSLTNKVYYCMINYIIII